MIQTLLHEAEHDDESLDYVPQGLKDYIRSAEAELEQQRNDFKIFNSSIAHTDTNSIATGSKLREATKVELLQKGEETNIANDAVSFTQCRRSKRLHRKGMKDKDDTIKLSIAIKKRITANSTEPPN